MSTYMEKKKIVLIVIAILVAICGLLGLSYAYWKFSGMQENKNVVMSDCFEIMFQGENSINLQNTYPLDDDAFNEFLKTAVPYHFTVTNKCSSMASASINLEVLATDGVKRLPDSAIDALLYNGSKSITDIDNEQAFLDIYNSFGLSFSSQNKNKFLRYNLTNYPVSQEKVIPEAVSAYNMYNFILAGNSSREFNLLLSMDKDIFPTNEVMNANFKSKITVSTAYNNMSGLLQENCFVRSGLWPSDCDDTVLAFLYYGYRTTKIIIQNELKPIEEAIESFDESHNKDRSVIS